MTLEAEVSAAPPQWRCERPSRPHELKVDDVLAELMDSDSAILDYLK